MKGFPDPIAPIGCVELQKEYKDDRIMRSVSTNYCPYRQAGITPFARFKSLFFVSILIPCEDRRL
jgi:hypothetical protein